MTDQQLEHTLQSAIEHAAPDRLEQILSRCQNQEHPQATKPQRHRRRATPWLAAACLALLVAGGALMQQANAVASVISLDVNPSLELRVNRSERVLSCTALNDDARTILGDMDLKGTQLDVAVNAIIGSLVQNGYLDSLSSAILISVEDSNTQRAQRLQQDLTGQVDTALQNASANADILSQTITQDAGLETQARENNISVGKAYLIREVMETNGAIANDSATALNQLSALSVEELKQLLESGSQKLPIGREAAAHAAESYAGTLAINSVTWEVDPELDEIPAHYEVELYTAFGEFEYMVDAFTGDILSGSPDILVGIDTSSQSGSTPAPSVGPTDRSIGAEQAQEIALNHAGLRREQVTALQIDQDWDDGRLEYSVEFRFGSIEYEYEIDGASGTILSAEQDED